MKNMRPTGPTKGRVKPTMGSARNGKPVKKAFLGSLLGGAGKSMLGGIAGQALGGIASQALGGLMGGGNKGGGQAAGGQGGGQAAQAPMPRKSTDTTPVKTKSMMKKGGKVSKAKNGKSFPDLNKDGKITKADILKGRGVIAKKGMTVKKAQTGKKLTPNYSNIKAGGFDSFKTPTAKDSADYRAGFDTKIKNKELKQSDRPSGTKIRGYNEAYKRTKKAKAGASVKKCRYGCK
jgi:hypothetical protein